MKTLFTTNVIYTTLDTDIYTTSDKPVILNCKLEQTHYGSVIVTRNVLEFEKKVEFYPNKIEHIIHT